MADVEVKIDGLEELANTLEAMPRRLAGAAARPALNAAGQVFQAALQSTVPRGATGELAKSIKRKVRVSRDLKELQVLVGPAYQGGYKHTSQDPGVRSQFLEFGTKKMAPRFFMRRAFAASAQAATNAAIAVLKAVVGAIPK